MAGPPHMRGEEPRKPWCSARCALWAVLVTGILLRLPLLAHPGYAPDVPMYVRWGWAASEGGLGAAYGAGADYPPLYLYVLAALGWVARALSFPPPGDQIAPAAIVLFKLPPLVGDIGLACTVYLAARRWVSEPRAVIATASVVFNPALIYATVLWGQIGSLHTLFMVAALTAAASGRPAAAGGFWIVSFLTKPHAIVAAPALAVSLARRSAVALLQAAIGGVVVAVTVLGPVLVSGDIGRIAGAYLGALGVHPAITMHAYNLWYVLTGGRGNWTGQLTPENSDTQLLVGSVTYRMAGLALFATWTILIMVLQSRRRERWSVWVSAAAIALGFFSLLTQMHERYLYPAVVFLAVVAWADRRLAVLFALASVTLLLNLVIVWPATPSLLEMTRTISRDARLVIASLNLAMLATLVGWLLWARPTAGGSHRMPDRTVH